MSIRANLHTFTGHRGRTRRYFAIYRIGGDDRRRIEASLETTRRRRPDSFGFRLHFGNRGSETPIDGHIDLGWFAIFWSFNAPGLGRLLERICWGHKRDIYMAVHGGHLWWRLWFDDDGGYDRYHNCDSWRQPKVWPWSRGRKKHRAWMCLRDGNIELNPLDALWGHRYFDYEDLESATAVVPVGQFPGDEYEVQFTLQKQTRARRFGPKWARHRSDEGWTASWNCRPGIPVRNHDWKGDEILGSAERVDQPDGWLELAVASLAERVKRDRIHHRYCPPAKATP